jgi:hypothetical protein
MNQKAVGIFLIIFGGYLGIGNTIFSMLFNYAGPIGFYVPMSPEEYWLSWWMQYGAITVLIAGAGILLVILGIRTLIRNKTILIDQ